MSASGDLLQLGDELRNGLEEVGDEAVIRDLENRRVGVLVDRDDRLRPLHSSQVLDRPGDADREVELRRDDASGLANLQLGRRVAGVTGRAARAERRAEKVRERVEHLRELLLESAPAGD